MPRSSGAPGTPGAQHSRAAHGFPPATPDSMWYPSCASPPCMAPGWHRHPRQHARHARARKHATRACLHTPCCPLPSTCPGTGLQQRRDTVTSETRAHACACTPFPRAHLQWGTCGRSLSGTSTPALLLARSCAHVATSTHTAPSSSLPLPWGSPGATCSAGVWADGTSLPGPLALASRLPCHQVPPALLPSPSPKADRAQGALREGGSAWLTLGVTWQP